MYLAHALIVPVFYYSLLLSVCGFNALSIGAEGMRMEKAAWASFTVNTLIYPFFN
jgi:hypothetical protein